MGMGKGYRVILGSLLGLCSEFNTANSFRQGQ